MAYSNTAAEIRPELNSVLEEALGADKSFIGLDLFPIFTVDRSSGEYRKLTVASTALLKAGGDLQRGPKGSYPQVDWTWEKDSYLTTDRGIEQFIDDVVAADVAHAFSVESQASKLLLRRVRFAHEQRIKAKTFDTSTFDAVNSSVAYTEANLATMDVPLDLISAVDRVRSRGEEVNTLALGRDAWNRVRRSDKLAKFFFGQLGGSQQITPQMFAEKFEIANIRIGDAVVDTAQPGIAASLSRIWTPDYIWVGNVQGGDYAEGGAGRTLIWTGDTGGSLFVTETYRKEDIRSDVVRVRSNTAEKVISARSGTLVTTQYA
jgi:hypothetical protein